MASISALILLLVCLLFSIPTSSATNHYCDKVFELLEPCADYVRGTGGPVPRACCKGVKGVKGLIHSRIDRYAACECVKAATKSAGSVRPYVVTAIPCLCEISLPFSVKPDVDCTRYK